MKKPAKMARIKPQPLLAVRDVQASSRFYQRLLGSESGHGRDKYDNSSITAT